MQLSTRPTAEDEPSSITFLIDMSDPSKEGFPVEVLDRPVSDELSDIRNFNHLLLRDRKAIAKSRWRLHRRLAAKLHRIWKRTKPLHYDPHIGTILMHINASKGIVKRKPSDSESAVSYRRQILDRLIRCEEALIDSLPAGRALEAARARLVVFQQWRAAS